MPVKTDAGATQKKPGFFKKPGFLTTVPVGSALALQSARKCQVWGGTHPTSYGQMPTLGRNAPHTGSLATAPSQIVL
ncbi:MAG: hypothetical protein MUC60_11500 [Oscillatoria sp. Prado101]|nr:hypothetical protein [Oscillatoria sp. Prado101]